MILYNSENSIRDIGTFCCPLFCYRSVVTCTSSLIQEWRRYEIWQANITEIALLNLAGWVHPCAGAIENDTPLKNDTRLGTELSFKFNEAIEEKGKAFSDTEIIFKNALMSGSLPVSKLRFNLKQCACAVKIKASTFASLAASSVYNNFACIAIVMLVCDGLVVVRTY